MVREPDYWKYPDSVQADNKMKMTHNWKFFGHSKIAETDVPIQIALELLYTTPSPTKYVQIAYKSHYIQKNTDFLGLNFPEKFGGKFRINQYTLVSTLSIHRLLPSTLLG